MSRAFVFPGQGSQSPGMGDDLARAFGAAREVFAEVDDALDFHLFRLMREGPEETLTLTENAQPALLAVSLAVIRVLEHESGRPASTMADLVAGHSLGEYSALTAARSLALGPAVRLLRLRGQAMQRATPPGMGAMAAILGLELEQVAAIADEAAANGDVCTAANDNAPGQVVISGHAAAVDRAIDIAKARGARRAVTLPVSAPFHCPLMAPAAAEMEAALKDTAIAAPAIPLIANVTAASVTDPETIRQQLVAQICGRVRWRESVLTMRDSGTTMLAEIGAGKVLSGLARRIDRDLSVMSVGTPAEVEAFLNTL